MIHSMTAFSRFSLTFDLGLLTLEIQSLNRKHLEVQTLLPRELLDFDALIKKEIQKRLSRGKVHCYISFTPHENATGIELTPNLSLSKEIQKAWKKISDHLDLQDSERGLVQLLTRESNLFQSSVSASFTQKIESALLKALDEALSQLITMRKKEGAHLKLELKKRTEALSQFRTQVEKLSISTVELQQKKLKERLEKLLETSIEKDERFMREVALLADKVDITEELTRIGSHLEQFAQVIETETKGHGKMLDFISQELNREWNTIGAKCLDHDISLIVLKAKSECEKIREQIHNIE